MWKEEFSLTKPLNHIAFIMDGNGRWAKKRLLPRSMGHKEGCKRIKEISLACLKYHIFAMSIYVFSTENWNRPQKEIDYLFKLLKIFFEKDIKEMNEKGIKFVVSGDLNDERIPKDIIKTINDSVELTKNNKDMVLNVCFNYGGQRELVFMCQHIASDYKKGLISLDDINDKSLSNYLYQKELPPVDLMIRTSGEQRISNYMLYELAYSEFIFTPIYWPDFKENVLVELLKSYEQRERRFGGIKDDK